MAAKPDPDSGPLSRNRMVFIHSRGERKFIGRSPSESAAEVKVEDIEALASAGFDIVEFNMSDGKPLCAALTAASSGAAAMHRNHFRPLPSQDYPPLEISESRTRLGLDLRLD
jgi:hypothetical protein